MKTLLVSAYGCEPNKGSEPGLGWDWVSELSKYNKVIVITRKNNKEKIEAVNKNKNLIFKYYDLPDKLKAWKKGEKGIYLYYYLWQWGCYRLAKRIVREEKIDIAISMTFGTIWLPTFLYRLPCKFVWGPLGGGEGVPVELQNVLSRKQKFYEKIRGINRRIPITNIWFKKICKKASLIVCKTNDTYDCIPKNYKDKCMTFIETGIHEEKLPMYKEYRDKGISADKSNYFIINAMLRPYKLVPLGVDAFSLIHERHPEIELHIIGDGPDRGRLEKQIKDLNLEGAVHLDGRVTHEEALTLMANSKGVLITSAREQGSYVMLESMVFKKPIICFRTSGMAVMVTEDTGIFIPVEPYEKAKYDFANAAIRLIEDNNLTNTLGENGLKRIEEKLTYGKKMKIFDSILDKVLNNEEVRNEDIYYNEN